MTRTTAAILVSGVMLGGLALSAALAKFFDFAAAGALMAAAIYYPVVVLIYRRMWRAYPPPRTDPAHLARLPYTLGAGTLILIACSIGIMRGTGFVTSGASIGLEAAFALAGFALMLIALRTDWLLGGPRE